MGKGWDVGVLSQGKQEVKCQREGLRTTCQGPVYWEEMTCYKRVLKRWRPSIQKMTLLVTFCIYIIVDKVIYADMSIKTKAKEHTALCNQRSSQESMNSDSAFRMPVGNSLIKDLRSLYML